MTLHHPLWLILLPVLLAGMWRAVSRPPPTVLVATLEPFQDKARPSPGGPCHPSRWPKYLLGLGTVFLVIALARPRQASEHQIDRFEGIDIMLVLDLSGSMRDIYDQIDQALVGRPLAAPPSQLGLKSRLEIGLEQLERFITDRPHDRIGLIAFTRAPYLVSPLTNDHDFIIEQLPELRQTELPDGTELAGPLISAVARLRDSEAPGRVIILFSDGKDNIQLPITPRQAGRLAGEHGIIIHTVGIGGAAAFSRRNTLAGPVLEPVDESFDGPLLKALAELTGGSFLQAGTEDEWNRVIEQIDKLAVTTFEQPKSIEYSELFHGWLLTGWILIFLGLLLERTLCRVLP